MADEKISDLTEIVAASIDGTEETVIEKSGANFRQKNSSFASRYGLFPAGTNFYNVLLSQSGSTVADAPTVTRTIQNTLGAIVWTRTGAGIYTGTLAGAFSDYSKIEFLTGSSVATGVTASIIINPIDANSFTLTCYDLISLSNQDNILSNTALKISILP